MLTYHAEIEPGSSSRTGVYFESETVANIAEAAHRIVLSESFDPHRKAFLAGETKLRVHPAGSEGYPALSCRQWQLVFKVSSKVVCKWKQ